MFFVVCLVLFKVLSGEANSRWNWFALLYVVGVWLLSFTPSIFPPPFLPPGSLVLPSWIFLCMCDGFCNEGALMWRRSRVSRVLSWVGGEECEAGIAWLCVLIKTPVFSHPEYKCISLDFRCFSLPAVQSAFSSLVYICFYMPVFEIYSIYKLVYFLSIP